MTDATAQPAAVAAPAARLARVVALWAGGAALVAVAVAWNRGAADAAAFGVLSVAAATLAGFGVLTAFGPRPMAGWAFPVLGAQLVRTLLAPAIGLAVFLSLDLDAMGFWMTLLAVAFAALAGETIAVAKMFGAGAGVPAAREAAA